MDYRRRRRLRWSELKPYLERPPVDRSVPRRLRGSHTIEDVRAAARRAVPRPVFDFVDGAAEREATAARSVDAFSRIEFMPRALTGVESDGPRTTLLGREAAMPVVLAPTGFVRLSNRLGEIAVAAAAAKKQVPYTLSTFGTVSIEELAESAPDADLWFQLYVLRDRGLTASLVDRAQAAGYRALVLTVDSVVTGKRLRDLHNGFAIPPRLTAKSFAQFGMRPRWSFDQLTSLPLDLASVRSDSNDLWSILKDLADPTFSFPDIVGFRDRWSGPLVLKGILTVEDAVTAANLGADAIVLSNHGGRQLDRVPVGLELLDAVRQAVGDRLEVYIDGGVLSGADVIAARGFGATGCFIGRPYLYGLQAGGQAGVEHVLDLYASDCDRTVRLLGVKGADAVDASMVRLRDIGLP